jgi:hypothetical protein
VLYDVAIINDTTIWAVGEIYLKDSTGQVDPNLFNVAVWNGSGWRFFRGPLSPFNAVFAFGPQDIWAGTSAPYHWNGTSWTGYNVTGIFGGYIRKIWGTSSTDLYIVGTNGSIAHFDGTTWRRIESGTGVEIRDIWGAVDPTTGLRAILCASSSVFDEGEKRIIRISHPDVVDTLSWGTGRRVSSVWFVTMEKLFAAGGGVFVGSQGHDWTEQVELPLVFTERVRGNASNDVIVAGDFGYLAHWNGASWRYYPGRAFPSFYGSWLSVAVRGDLVVAVGLIGDRAGAIFGRRR